MPYIVYFCNLFAQKLDLIDLRVDEFEEAIMDDCGTERNIVVVHLLQKLLKPFINRAVDLTTYEQFLLQTLKKYNLENLFLQNKPENQWSQLTMLTKCDIIYNLCELRLQLPDVEAKLTDFESNDLRVEPLGLDSAGNKLWYFGDLRLYEEKAPEKKKKVVKEEKQPKTTEDNKKKSTSRVQSKSNSNKSPAKKPVKPTKSTKVTKKQPVKNDKKTTAAKNKELLSKSLPVAPVGSRSKRSMAPPPPETTIQTRRSARNLNKTISEAPPPPPPVVDEEDNESTVDHDDESESVDQEEDVDIKEGESEEEGNSDADEEDEGNESSENDEDEDNEDQEIGRAHV